MGLNEQKREKELEANASKQKGKKALLGLTARDWKKNWKKTQARNRGTKQS